MLTLTLDGQAVDPPDDAAVALTLWANDLRSSTSREATYSETFTLPQSHRNSAALGVPHVLGSTTDAPYRRIPAELRANGVLVLPGVAVLEGTTAAGYDVTLYAATADLFALVKDRKLRDLDLSAYDHKLTYADVSAAVGNAYNKAYAYPLTDDGHLTRRAAMPLHNNETWVLYTDLPPFVYADAILQQIVAENLPDYTLAGSLLNELRYQQLAFPRARPFPVLRQSFRDNLRLLARAQADDVYSQYSGSKSYEAIAAAPDTSQTGAGATWSNLRQYVVDEHCDLNLFARLLVSADLLVSGVIAGGSFALRWVIDPDGPGATPSDRAYVLQTTEETSVDPVFNLPAVVRRFVQFDAEAKHLYPGDAVFLQLQLDGNIAVTIHQGSELRIELGERTYAGGPVHLDAALPDMSQADFLLLLAGIFQPIYQSDPVTRTLRADLFTDLERNRTAAVAVDWSDKLDRTNGATTYFRLDGYAQRNTYAYAVAEGYKELLLSDAVSRMSGTITVPDLTLESERAAYEAPVFPLRTHPATAGLLPWVPAVKPKTELPPAPYDNSQQYGQGLADNVFVVYRGRYWEYTDADAYPAGSLKPGDYYTVSGSSQRYYPWTERSESDYYESLTDDLAAVALLIPASGSFSVRDDDGTGAGTTPLLLTATNGGLGFATDLLPAYYSNLSALLQGARILAVDFTLSPSDIAALDFTVPVWLDVRHWQGVGPLRGYFYCNLIQDYTPGIAGATRVELIKLGDPIANLTPVQSPLRARHRQSQWLEQGVPFYTEAPDGNILIEEDGL